MTARGPAASLELVLRTGIDLVDVGDVRAALDAHGERYLRRVFHPAEVADCAGDPARLAARFAAKEAVIKVLRPGDEAVPWNEIRVRRHPGGWVDAELLGRARALAEREGITELALSLSHEGDLATATAVASAPRDSVGSTI